MQDLDKCVTSTINVTDTGRIYCQPGGVYQMDEAGPDEQLVAKFHLLEHFAALAAEDLMQNGQIKTVFGTEIQKLAERLYSEYEKFVTHGVDIFALHEYYRPEVLEKYHHRPICGKHLNAGPNEQLGAPAGWFYDFPGWMTKYTELGKVVIDQEGQTYRVGIYEPDDDDHSNPIHWLELITIDDCTIVYDKLPELAPEIMDAIMFMKRHCQI